MNDTNITKDEPFDLEGASKEEREEFTQDVGEILMQKILRKAWAELDSSKRDILTDLLEKSEADPEDEKKHKEIFTFLDTHIVNLSEFIARELEGIQTTYRESRDQFRDTQL